jgi:hypothetical protein
MECRREPEATKVPRIFLSLIFAFTPSTLLPLLSNVLKKELKV